jgi:hypothetical protein
LNPNNFGSTGANAMLFDWIERGNQGLSSESKITTFAPVDPKLQTVEVDYKIDYTLTKSLDIIDNGIYVTDWDAYACFDEDRHQQQGVGAHWTSCCVCRSIQDLGHRTVDAPGGK